MPLSINPNLLYYINMKPLPEQIPIFPLSGFIYFPKTSLPLNIFEERYLNLVNDAFKKDKLMGMIQSKNEGNEIFKVGCLGKINDFQKIDGGRILINLIGLTRFEVIEEINNFKLYREFKVDYQKYNLDLKLTDEQIDTNSLMKKSKIFFEKNKILLNWKEFDKLKKAEKINTLSMIAPIMNEEKQKLLESISLRDKVLALENIIEFYLHEVNFANQTIQ